MVRLAATGALCGVLATLAACGGEAERRDGDRGGVLTMLAASDVDFLDPGHTSFVQGIQVAAATQRPLFRYRPNDLTQLRPDLAAARPDVSADGRTVTVKLRRGVRFSPPVDREVTSRDVAYALERFFSANVGGPYLSYFRDLVGAPRKPTDGVQPIRGITTPDDHTIVFQLSEPTSASFVSALSLPASAPVPEDYARPFDAKSPSTYNTHVIATGPYMVRNNDAGETVGYQAGRSIELVRNPNWDHRTDERPAHVDSIKIVTNATDGGVAARQVLAGTGMVYAIQPPPSILKVVSTGAQRAQAVKVSAGDYRFLPLTTTIKPFDRLDVRKAVLAVFDRSAVRVARGGTSTGPLATHFIPPGIPGYGEAGGERGPNVDFLSPDRPHGDPDIAKAYMRKAGFPSGKYTGSERFLVVSGNAVSERNVAEVVRAQLQKLGFRIDLRFVPDDALFTNWCTVPSKKVLACSGVAWLKDFPDPEPLLMPVFYGGAITDSTGNTNFSQLDDPAVDAAMDRARLLSGDARAAAWGAIDRAIVEHAAAVPLQWDTLTLIHSKDVDGIASETFGSWDFSYTSIK